MEFLFSEGCDKNHNIVCFGISHYVRKQEKKKTVRKKKTVFPENKQWD